MSSDQRNSGEAGQHPTILVVRRRAGDHGDGHHGGVWKIAYADFMTAMMAFFLVMWLVNSADDKTIVQVAAYFNPMRLSEKVPSDRGLADGTHSAKEAKAGSAAAAGKAKSNADDAAPKPAPQKAESKREAKKRAEREQQLFADPVQTLNELAAASMPTGDVPRVGQHAATRPQPLPDPFARGVQPNGDQPPPDTNRARADASAPQRSAPAPTAPNVSAAEKREAALGAMKSDMETAVAAALAVRGSPVPRVDVRVTSEGVLLSVSDDANFGMFAVGSAEPRPELIAVMEDIADILRARPGRLVIRGHTDNRLYKSRAYDNWRLSSARAHMAHYMLSRGGIEEQRIERIEGHADQVLRNPRDGAAAENRRIEILLKVETS